MENKEFWNPTPLRLSSFLHSMRGTTNEHIFLTTNRTHITRRCTWNSALISSIICFTTPKKCSNTKIYRGNAIYAVSKQDTKHSLFCATFIRRPHEFLCVGVAITKRERITHALRALPNLLCLSGLVFHWYVRRLSNLCTYQYWINLITVIILTHRFYTNLMSAHSHS
jgi:hypothetical protein